MRRFFSIVLAAASAPICTISGRADELTAGALVQLCESKDEGIKAGCGLFVLGAVQGIGIATLETSNKRIFCITGDNRDLSPAQLAEIFQKAMQTDFRVHPEDAKLPAVAAVSAAMEQAFPCKK